MTREALTDDASITFDETTALIIVDMQNDFASPDGSLFVSGGDQLTPLINDQIEAAEAAGAFVVYTQDWHPEETPHFNTSGGVWPVHCVRNTWGAELCSDLRVAGPVVRKGTGGEDGYSGFTMRDAETGETIETELNTLLKDHEIERTVVVGLALDVCVKATAIDALDNGYEVIVPLATSAAVNLEPENGGLAVNELMELGAIVVE